MNFEEIWQENKSFILTIMAGLVVFIVAYLIIDSSSSELLPRDSRTSSFSRSLACSLQSADMPSWRMSRSIELIRLLTSRFRSSSIRR